MFTAELRVIRILFYTVATYGALAILSCVGKALKFENYLPDTASKLVDIEMTIVMIPNIGCMISGSNISRITYSIVVYRSVK